MKYIDMVNEGKENFKNLEEEELNISSIELERKIKYALLDILKEDLAYNYKTSIKYSKSLEVYKNMFVNRIKDYGAFEEKNLIVLHKIGYKKLNKQHYIMFMSVLKKSLVDFKKYLSQLDIEKTFENKGMLWEEVFKPLLKFK